MIKIKVDYANGLKDEFEAHFFLIDSAISKSYQVKLRRSNDYDSPIQRYGRTINDIDYLVDPETYTLNREVFAMMFPSHDVDLVATMIKEFKNKDYHHMYHGSQSSYFWENPKKALAEMSPKYRKPYTLEEAYTLIREAKKDVLSVSN